MSSNKHGKIFGLFDYMRLMKKYLILLRPKQYIKNLFLFAPLIFAFQYNELRKILVIMFAFLIFSIAASSIYILNDLLDLEEDKKHPRKKYRPLASGLISKNKAMIILSLLMIISIVLSYFVDIYFLLIILIYIFNNVLYSLKLKHISVLDIIIIAFGFLLRVIAGGVVANIDISIWLILMTFLLAIFLGFAKRRDDVILYIKGLATRKNIDGYNLEFINAVMIVMSAVTIVSYILYTVSAEVTNKFHSHNLYITSFFVIMGILRYMQITFVNEDSGSPTDLVYKDRFLQITVILWIISFIIIVKILA